MREHQSILTNATVLKDSEIGILIVVKVFQRIKEMCG